MPDNTTPTPIKEIPNWVTEDPEQTTYNLVAQYPGEIILCQDIKLTRDEFLQLKRYIAELRGFIPEEDCIVPLAKAEWDKLKEALELMRSVLG